MKRIGKRLWGGLLCALLLVGLTLPLTVRAEADTARGASVDTTLYYGREALSALPNAEALLYAYDQIVSGVAASQETIPIYDGSNAISQEELVTVMDAYRRDHAEQFWIASDYRMTYYDTDCVLSIAPTYLLSGEELALAKRRFADACERILSELDAGMSEFEAELYLHDRLAAGVFYDASGANAHNAYGALVEGVAVCEGYAEALQVLLHMWGMRSFIVLGESYNPATGIAESHAWNLVRVDGEYYHVDLTWNDQSTRLYHAYFNQTDAVMLRDHTITPTVYALPACGSDRANYFVQRGGLLNDYTAERIGQLLREQNLQASVYLPTDSEAFVAWYGENISDIARAANVYGAYTYSYGRLGNEVYLQIVTCRHTALTYVAAREATCTDDGNRAYYVCECGKLFEDAEATVRIEGLDRVRLLAHGHNRDTVDCTADRVCLTCGNVEAGADAHAWAEANCTAPRRCTDCGATEGEATGHVDRDRDGLCERCHASVSLRQTGTGESDGARLTEWLPLWIGVGGALILLVGVAAVFISRRIG